MLIVAILIAMLSGEDVVQRSGDLFVVKTSDSLVRIYSKDVVDTLRLHDTIISRVECSELVPVCAVVWKNFKRKGAFLSGNYGKTKWRKKIAVIPEGQKYFSPSGKWLSLWASDGYMIFNLSNSSFKKRIIEPSFFDTAEIQLYGNSLGGAFQIAWNQDDLIVFGSGIGEVADIALVDLKGCRILSEARVSIGDAQKIKIWQEILFRNGIDFRENDKGRIKMSCSDSSSK